VASESEFDKQKALFEQKIEFLEKALEDSNKREKEITVELKNCKKDFLNQNKEQTSVLEKQIKDMNKIMEELKETNYE
jgi:chromosome segregation ATPase|tara:strand:+ start:204 stop:437 length:234 start_codon:yes stop_codon:yes gene_type:complete